MAFKTTTRKPKIQRGLSITPELAAAIQHDAQKFGKTWNEVAETALNVVFGVAGNLQNRAEHTTNAHETVDLSDD